MVLLAQVLHLLLNVLRHLAMEYVGVLVVIVVIHLAQKSVTVAVTPRV